MAMRIYSKEDFEKELKKIDFQKTELKSEVHEIWKHKEGQIFSMPTDLEKYPDYLLGRALMSIGQLYYNNNKPNCGCIDYEIKKKEV